MPEPDVLAIGRQMLGNERTKNVSIIILSAKSLAHTKTKSINIGVTEIDAKPFYLETLEHAVAKYLAKGIHV